MPINHRMYVRSSSCDRTLNWRSSLYTGAMLLRDFTGQAEATFKGGCVKMAGLEEPINPVRTIELGRHSLGGGRRFL